MAVDFIQNRNAAADFAGNIYVEIGCKAADTKPTGNFLTGSKCIEVDTGKTWYYDRAGAKWIDPTAT